MTRQRVPNPELAQDTARLNLLTNGGFEIWQRSTNAMPIGSNGLYHADRWQGFIQGTSTLSIQADAGNQDTGSWRCAQATVGGGATVGGPAFIYQNFITSFAAGDGQQLRGRILSASVRVKASAASTCRISIEDSTAGPVSSFSSYHPGGNVYQTLTVTTSAPIVANCTNASLKVFFEANGTYWVDNAMLVVGSVPADYAPLHPADDLARCLRYYQRDMVAARFVATAASQVDWTPVPYKSSMAVTPTVTFGTPNYNVNQQAGSPTLILTSTEGATLNMTANAAGDTYYAATVTLEANP